MEFAAQANFELAQKIRKNLELSLDNFIVEHKDRRKLIQTSVDRAHRNKQLHQGQVAKAKEKYEAECAKLVSLEHQLESANVREAERLRMKTDKSQNEIRTLEREYQSACAKLSQAVTVWNGEWKSACDRFQEMEEKRIEFLHHSLCVYVNILSTASGQDQESYERVWKSLDEFNVKSDIDQFISEKGTGPMIPEAPIFVSYFDDPAKTLPRFQVAQFDEHTRPSVTRKASVNRQVSVERKSSVKPRTPSILKKPALAPIDPNVSLPSSTGSSPTLASKSRSFFYNDPEEEEEEAPPKKPAPARSNSTRRPYDEQDEVIDANTQVVFSVGHNLFEVDHKEQVKRPHNPPRSVHQTEEAFHQSIHGLLQELGVQPVHASNSSSQYLSNSGSQYLSNKGYFSRSSRRYSDDTRQRHLPPVPGPRAFPQQARSRMYSGGEYAQNDAYYSR
ncbi:hypothetical protein BCR43DRAFT_499672 [Syncephalastrum racemosum]|uniref:F-BAR domain-containing protein n=1 Tax=Syncephalastrum racemosum TaxID=13706 RepID=A0A1X2GZM3_SYNRA|nr:hypothetical protein BCR43DRAFT_499672 [Syncephalastrum racemosum]